MTTSYSPNQDSETITLSGNKYYDVEDLYDDWYRCRLYFMVMPVNRDEPEPDRYGLYHGRNTKIEKSDGLTVNYRNNEWFVNHNHLKLNENKNKVLVFYSKDKGSFHKMLQSVMGFDKKHENDGRYPDYAISRYKYCYVRTPNNQFDLVNLGFKYGIKEVPHTVAMLQSTPHRYYPGHTQHTGEAKGKVLMPVKNWTWETGAETKCIANIKKGLQELILEKLWSALEHWKLYDEVNSLVDDDLLRRKRLNEQEREAHRVWARTKFGNARSNRIETAWQIQQVWQGIDRNFASANTLDKALAACKKYIDGKLGVDWFIHDMFHPVYQKYSYEDSKKQIYYEKHEHSFEHAGDDSMSISTSKLKPMLKLHPGVANLLPG